MTKIFNRHPVQIVLLAVVYFATARLGLLLAYPGTNATPIWMPTGIALSAVLLFGNRMWPGIALGAFFVNFVHLAGLDLTIPVSLVASFSTSVGNTLEALIGAYLIHRNTGTRNPFERSGDIFAFILFGALISTTVSATIGTATFCLSVSEWRDFATIWLTWWLGDAVGAIVLVPLIMTCKGLDIAAWNFRATWGNLLLSVLIITASCIVFLIGYPLAFILLPILIVSAFRFGQFGSAMAICIISGFSIYGTVNGIGQFVAGTRIESLLLQQGFIGSIAIATMVLAATVSEQKKSESDIIESVRYNRLLFELSPIGLALCRMNGSLVDINPAYAKIIGRSVKEALQLSYWDITPLEYAEQEKVQLKRLEDVGSYGPYEKEYIHKDGHLVPVRLQGLIIEKDGEKFIWSCVEDISERKAAERELQKNERLLRLFVEHAPAAIAMFDHNMRYIAASRRFLADYGLAGREIIGRSHYEVFPDIPERWREVHRRCLAGAVEKSEEDFFPRMDGNADWVRWEIRPWYESPGEIGGVILFSEVITERKKAEEDLRAERDLSVKALDSMPGIFYMYDEGRKFLRWNKKFEEVSGYSGDEISRMNPLDFFSGRDKELLGERIQDVFSVGYSDVEADFVSKDGTRTPYYFTGAAVLYEGKTCLVGMGIDISKRKLVETELMTHRQHLEGLIRERTVDLKESQEALLNIVEDLNFKTDELEAANAKLRELDRLKSMFIASMSHELRTPLNSIIGFSGIILQGMSGEINEEQRDQLGRVFRSGKHLLSLVTDVIDIAKIESGRIVPYPEKFDLHGLIDEAVGQIRPQANDKGLAIEEILPDLPVLMHSDRKRLLQCMLNYLSNAVKFSETGTVTVEVAVGAEGRRQKAEGEEKVLPDGWLEFSVRDTGIGIKEEDKPLLFGSFVRLESHLKTTTPGTGLGLYLTRKLVSEVLSGEVGMESRLGEGSRFWLRVPVDLEVGE